MVYYLNWFNNWLSRRMFLVVSVAALLGFFMPLSNLHLKDMSLYLIAFMTLMTSLGTSFKKFAQVIVNPWASLLSLLLIHIFSPLLAWLLGAVFYPGEPMTRLGFLIAASIPIAVTSIMWTSITKGNVPVTIMAVTLDTFLVPVIFPSFLFFVANGAYDINYYKLVTDLLFMVTIPSLLGMLLNDLSRGKINTFAQSFGGISAKIANFLVIFINASVVAPQLDWTLSLVKTLFVVLIMVVSGYTIGYLGSFLLKKRTPDMISAMIYNVGMRNNSFGLVLALSYFPPAAAIPITLSMLFQQPVAALVSTFLAPEA